MASRMGGDLIEMDVAPTADGRIAIFHDWTFDCKTDGHGDVRARTLAELQALDVGYGYTADGGKSFPLRGLGKDRIPSLEEALSALPNTIEEVLESGDRAPTAAITGAGINGGDEGQTLAFDASTSSDPPSASASRLAIASPSPVPVPRSRVGFLI